MWHEQVRYKRLTCSPPATEGEASEVRGSSISPEFESVASWKGGGGGTLPGEGSAYGHSE